jgi:tetratricopeptide (TPR) repeat protein
MTINTLLAIPLSITISISTLKAQVSNQANLARISEQEIQMQEKYMAAVVQLHLGKQEGAAKLFEEVFEKNNKCDGCAFQLARIYTQIGDNQRAIDNAKKAVAIDPKNKWYKMALAESYEKIGKDKDAADVYRTLAEGDAFKSEYNQEIYFRWVYTIVRMGEPVKAIKILDDLEKKVGISEEITIKKQTVYEAMGDVKKAANEIRKLADKFPTTIDYQHIAAEYFLKIGDKAVSNEFYQRILKLDPNDSKARLALASGQKPSSGGNADVAYLNTLKDLFKKSDIKIDDKIKTFLPYVNKIADSKDKSLAATGLELAQIIEQRTLPMPKPIP